MSKFKVGDRVRITGCTEITHYVRVGAETEIIRVHPGDQYSVEQDGQIIAACDLELVPPPEHPALTLAKAEVVRLSAKDFESRSSREDGRLAAWREVLYAFGLEYRSKPVVPQPPEYEFLPVQDAG